MKAVAKKMYVGSLIVLTILIVSCAFPFQEGEKPELSDISGQLGYNGISRQAFIGGSLLYNPDQLSSGHLMPGVHIAVRLGRVDKDESTLEQPSFSDRANDAHYGYITVGTIDTTQIAFSYTQYDWKGSNKTSSSHSVYINESVDINGDGIPDLTYNTPARKRPGMEKAMYLTFLSSQDMLNTTMFAVLPEQYSRGAYPNGLIGINPDGKFIVAKYEHEKSLVRSATQGLVYGDYVLDYQTGNYQKVTGTGSYRSARSVDDADLTDVSSIEKIDMYFTVTEFDNILTAENMFRALPDNIQTLYSPENFTNETLIPILNQILESPDLIEQTAAVCDVGLTETELTEVHNGIHQIERTELIQINRLFLEDVFPDLCPKLQTNSDDVAFILPLLHYVIRGESDNETDASRGVVYAYRDYMSQKNAIKSKWSKYYSLGKNVPSFTFPKTIETPNLKNTSIETTNEVHIGIYGVVENNWGKSIKLGISAAAFLQIEWSQINLTKSFPKKSLLGGPVTLKDITAASFCIGPVLIQINCPIKFDLILAINGNLGFSTPCFMGFTGLYGAGACVGANYGLKWKKVLFLKIPTSFYFDPYFKGETISDFAFYAGPVENTVVSLLEGVSPITITNASASVELTPKVIFDPNVSAWRVIRLGLAVDSGLKGKFTVSALSGADKLLAQKKLPITGTASLHYVTSIGGKAHVGIDETILGIRINFGKTFTSPSFLEIDQQIGPTLKVF